MRKAHAAALVGAMMIGPVAAAGDVQINEMRRDQPGTDTDEYAELVGTPGASLDGLTYIVIGDDADLGDGFIEAAIDLTGLSLPADDGIFLMAEAVVLGVTPDFTTDLNFENQDNVTHCLVSGFTGKVGSDIDDDDDGVPNETLPWTGVVDAIGLVGANPPPAENHAYGAALGFEDVGPEGNFHPAAVYRCAPDGLWFLGTFDPADKNAVDTPGAANPDCPPVDISVMKTGPGVALSGSEITYTITVTNIGTEDATDVVITDTLPDGLSFIDETSPAEVSLDDDTEPTIVWSTEAVGPDETIVIELVAEIDAGVEGTIVNSVAITTTGDDIDESDNMDEASTFAGPEVDPPKGVFINEVRTNQPGADDDEYIELKGPGGTSLDGLTYVVLGDGAPELGSGVVEAIIPLSGNSIPEDGLFLVAEDSFSLQPLFTVELVFPADDNVLNFETNDNVTHVLAANYTGTIGDDLDLDDDGTLDIAIGSDVLDAVGFLQEPNPPKTTEYLYGESLGFEDVGPDGNFQPAHIWRCFDSLAWVVGVFDPDLADDTPGSENAECGVVCPPSDLDGDGDVDVDDLAMLILGWAPGGCDPCEGDVDGDGDTDVDDLVQLFLDWAPGGCG